MNILVLLIFALDLYLVFSLVIGRLGYEIQLKLHNQETQSKVFLKLQHKLKLCQELSIEEQDYLDFMTKRQTLLSITRAYTELLLVAVITITLGLALYSIY